MQSAEIKKLHLAHKNMISRCYDPASAAYANYGARGIAVCEEWRKSRAAFVSWALQSGHEMDLSLDRINNDKGYSPENCRWATISQQLNNQRRNHLVTLDGQQVTVAQAAAKLGIRQDTLARRLERMPEDRALSAGSIKPTWTHGTRRGYEVYACRCSECRAANAERHRERRARKSAEKAGGAPC